MQQDLRLNMPALMPHCCMQLTDSVPKRGATRLLARPIASEPRTQEIQLLPHAFIHI